MLAWTFLWPGPDTTTIAKADAIICLGGGMDAKGVLAEPTLKRVERCVALHDAGLAPMIIFTGGRATPSGPSAAGQMARYAETLGLTSYAELTENRAQSTLQNALYSLEMIPDANRLIVVTEAFHLPRSWASIKWAAWELGQTSPSITLIMSQDVPRDLSTGKPNKNILFRESIAIWFNGIRAVAYSVATRTALAKQPPVNWLH